VAESSWSDPAVSHYSAAGVLQQRVVAAPFVPTSVAADPWDDSVWVDEDGVVVHLAADGTELWRGASHLVAQGATDLQRLHCTIAVSALEGSAWIADGTAQVIRIARDGTEEDFHWAMRGILGCPAVDSSDGTLWSGGVGLHHLAPSGQAELWSGLADSAVSIISVNPSDGSCWAGLRGGTHEVAHVSRTGEELWRGDFRNIEAISVNPTDGSCWVADTDPPQTNGAVTHLSAGGEILWRGEGFVWPVTLAVNPTDGSCWVGDHDADLILLLAADGTELWRHSHPTRNTWEWEISVNPSDGSGWLAAGDLTLLSSQGAESWGGSLGDTYCGHVATDPYDGSSWAAASYDNGGNSVLLQVAADGEIRERIPGFLGLNGSYPISGPLVSLNHRDGSCWVADPNHGQVVHINAGCAPFRDVPCDYWALAYILACYNAGLVNGYGDYTYRPEQTVSRAAMAVYIARALAGGDASVPSGPGTASFPDVATTYWAFRHVEYCRTQGVVGGYADGYRPEEIVNRAQMAVYVARAIAGGDSGVPAGPGTATFPDVPTSQWAFKYIEYCKAQGVVGGYPEGTYRPDEAVNRAQMAVYVARAFGLPM